MSDVYSFRAGPTYRGAAPGEMFTAALEQPMSRTSTFFDQAKGGALESFGLGTAIRDFDTPDGAPIAANRYERPDAFAARRDAADPLAEDAYKSSAYFREGVPWDQAMTEDRAAALALAFDAKKVREFYAEKRPITAFIGNLAGQALDPVNYVPVAGPLVKTAAVAKLGRVAGAAVTSSIDAAANTAIFGMATAEQRGRYGDDVSWQATVSQIATAALIGAGFGAISGGLEARVNAKTRSAVQERLTTLKTTQEARIALNEGIDALVRGEDVALGPNATLPLARVAQEADAIAKAYEEVRMRPTGPSRDPLVRLTPEEIDGTIVTRGTFQNVNEAEFSKRGWGLVKIIWRHGDESGKPDGLRIEKEDITALPEVIRDNEPSSVSADGQQREWRVERNGRVVVYADTLMDGERHVVTAYVQDPTHADAAKPVSEKRKPVATSSSDEPLKPVGDTASQSLASPEKGRSLPAAPNIARNVAVDNSAPRAEPPPEGRDVAEKAVAKADDYKAMAAQYSVDADKGSFAEEADVAQIGVEGRLTEDDVATLADAQTAYEDGAAYGEALKTLVGCLL